ncbi:unnamed protein product, partial [Dovyalis caffra]
MGQKIEGEHTSLLLPILAILIKARLNKSIAEDGLIKSKEDLYATLKFSPMKHKKKATRKKYMNKSNGIILTNGSFDFEEYATDKEIKKLISKLNREYMDSENKTYDDRGNLNNKTHQTKDHIMQYRSLVLKKL